ncbi:UvrD/REP helicase N-terminal domain-containing protein [Pseudomonas orientalis]|uniref:UvrD/REP helicase N-terminal domain-containing protein n=1 Tax=Pseudomonas orientalis TaxID=76758 RepID=A0A8B3Y2S6_9PSED|nr:UvrD/REP helicase N-terminal domain-containing protein [Pseudomonas orientalis]
MQWTQKQQPIIHSTADKLLVQAFAGTGKTHTSPCVPSPREVP